MPSKKVMKKTVTKVSKKKEQKSVPAPEPAPTPEVTTPISSEVEEVKKTSSEVTDSIFNELQAQLCAMSAVGVQLPGLKKGLISLKRSFDKERKELAKALPKKKTKSVSSTPRAPSGFAKPAAISKELAKFIGEKQDVLVARTQVTRYITKYVKDNNLQDPANKRHIIPDAQLKKLLKCTDKDEVTYFNLQRYLKTHYPTSKPQTA